MLEGPYVALAVAGVLATGVMAGVFAAFSVLVMRGLGALPAREGVAAMNAINQAALTSVFMVLFLGTAAVCGVVAVVTFVLWPAEGRMELLLGSGLYLVGAFGVTAAANVPRNEKLRALGAESAEGLAYWPTYLREWTLWNHVRTAASGAAAVAYALALA
ncbi:MAG TPA: anthrone oxygenase family protein [Streptomyces sp.]